MLLMALCAVLSLSSKRQRLRLRLRRAAPFLLHPPIHPCACMHACACLTPGRFSAAHVSSAPSEVELVAPQPQLDTTASHISLRSRMGMQAWARASACRLGQSDDDRVRVDHMHVRMHLEAGRYVMRYLIRCTTKTWCVQQPGLQEALCIRPAMEHACWPGRRSAPAWQRHGGRRDDVLHHAAQRLHLTGARAAAQRVHAHAHAHASHRIACGHGQVHCPCMHAWYEAM